MPKTSELPEKLRPFVHHGLDLHYRDGSKEAIGDCPFCGREGKFSVNLNTGLFRCFVCSEGTEKGGGNVYVFLRKLLDLANEGLEISRPELNKLTVERKLLYTDSLIAWGVRQSPITQEWIVPGYNEAGKVTQLYKYYDNGKRRLWLPTPTLKHGLLGMNLWQQDKQEAYLCYSSDTEILTSEGWKFFNELSKQDKVAAYDKYTSSITFEEPKAIQKFDYEGPVNHFKSRWSELLVTPDHRMLVKRAKGKPKVLRAREVGGQFYFPVSGYLNRENGTSPTQVEARLLVAFVGDGCKRSTQIEFRFRKDRKKKRLKELLTRAGITHRSLVYPGSKDAESIMVYYKDAPFFLEYCPNKTWTGKELYWSEDSRKAMLHELQFWDGCCKRNQIKYFTAKKSEADLISALGVITGYATQVETKSSHEFVVGLLNKSWRGMKDRSKIQQYSGKVYCVTTSTGFVIVRRKGKSLIAGNCEGLWDAVALWETMGAYKDVGTELARTGNAKSSLLADANVLATPGCEIFQPSWRQLFSDKRVTLMAQNDHDREHNGKVVASASYHGMKKIVKELSSYQEPPHSIKMLFWGEVTFDSNLPTGYDIRDKLTKV